MVRRMAVITTACAMVALAAPADDAGAQERPAQPLWEVGVVAFGVSQQAYPGSDTHLSRGLALPFVIYRGRILRADAGTAGLRALKTDRLELDIGFAGAFGSRSGEVPARSGMPELGTLVEFGPRLKWRLTAPGERVAGGRWTVELPVRGVFDLSDGLARRGVSFEPELSYDRRLAGGLNLGLNVGAIFGNRELTDTFYGVAPAYAMAGRPAYVAQPGLIAWRLGASFSRPLGPDWRLFGFARFDSVRGAANADSPLVRSSGGLTAGLGVTWTWKRSERAGAE